jgi:hypothetical protein
MGDSRSTNEEESFSYKIVRESTPANRVGVVNKVSFGSVV